MTFEIGDRVVGSEIGWVRKLHLGVGVVIKIDTTRTFPIRVDWGDCRGIYYENELNLAASEELECENDLAEKWAEDFQVGE